jgi:LPS-assembly protein
MVFVFLYVNFKEFAVTKLSFGLTSLLIISMYPCMLQAETVETEEWQIEADKVTRFDTPNSVIAEGQVVLTKIRTLPPKQSKDKSTKTTEWSVLLEEAPHPQDTVTQEIDANAPPIHKTEVTIKADWIAYDMENNSIKARGNVSIANDTDRLMADEGTFNLNDETGTFKEATILRDSLDLHLEGKIIEKTGYNTYHLEDAWVITCKVDDNITPPWSFAAASADVTQGEYATLTHTTFRIKDVPILYTPWLMVPVGNTRQTGILFPEVSSSEYGGFSFNLPLFLNISDSADMTLYPEFYSNRGAMPGMEFRYALAPQQKAGIMASYMKDDLSDPSETDYWQSTGYTHTNDNRYWVRGKLDHDFDNDIVTRTDLDIVSDRDYLTEFDSGLTGFQSSQDHFLEAFGRGFQNKTNDQRENTLKILKSWDGMALEGVFLGINDVRATDSSPTPLWKLPSLDFTGNKLLGETSLSLEWDAAYVNYYREDGVGGHRFDIYPRLSMPLDLGPYLESRAEAGIRDTYYNVQTYGDSTWSNSTSPNRLLGEFHTEVGTTLLRDFDAKIGDMDGITHNFRPFVQYDFLSNTDQGDLPNFDSVDRKDDINQITYGIDNFFSLFGSQDGRKTERDYGYIKIQQSYDMRSVTSDEPLSPVEIKLRVNPFKQFNRAQLIYKTDISVYGNGSSHTVETGYNTSRGDFVTLDYRYDDLNNNDTHQINLALKTQLWETIFAKYDIEHSITESQIIEQNISLIYQPACWSVELQSRYTPGDTRFSILFNLANIGSPIGFDL